MELDGEERQCIGHYKRNRRFVIFTVRAKLMETLKDIRHHLYIELVKLQKEVIRADKKLLIILEGRDAAGKDGSIKTLTRHMSPRETRVVALNKPSDRQVREWFFQRYTPHLPASGEIVIFNRSWYNRAGVERVMGFCSDEEYQTFFPDVCHFEEMLVDAGFSILKYYLDISKDEQAQRLEDRRNNPLKQWKISPIDEQALAHWDAYSQARNKMLHETSFKFAPWHVVDANDKPTARIAWMWHVLHQLNYPGKELIKADERFNLVYGANDEKALTRLYH